MLKTKQTAGEEIKATPNESKKEPQMKTTREEASEKVRKQGKHGDEKETKREEETKK